MFRIICEDQATRQSSGNQHTVAQQEKCAGVCYRVPKPFINPSNYFSKKMRQSQIIRASSGPVGYGGTKSKFVSQPHAKRNCRNVYPLENRFI